MEAWKNMRRLEKPGNRNLMSGDEFAAAECITAASPFRGDKKMMWIKHHGLSTVMLGTMMERTLEYFPCHVRISSIM